MRKGKQCRRELARFMGRAKKTRPNLAALSWNQFAQAEEAYFFFSTANPAFLKASSPKTRAI
jgi:hypothetical protein